jgi:hypothetical protein
MDGYKRTPWRLLKIHLTDTRGGIYGEFIVSVFYEYAVVARIDCVRCVILQHTPSETVFILDSLHAFVV